MRGQLAKWDAPFGRISSPSCITIPGADPERSFRVVVAECLDTYPKYIVDFRGVLLLSFKEELEAILRPDMPPIPDGLVTWSAFIWQQSPQVQAYETLAETSNMPAAIRHFLIFGGDDVVEVICGADPIIEMVDESRILHAKYQS